MKTRKLITGILMALWSCSPTSCTDPSKEEFIPGGETGGTEGGKTTEIVWHERAYDTYLAIEKLYGVTSGSTAGFFNENYPKGAGAHAECR